MSEALAIKCLTGQSPELRDYIPELAKLRIRVFRDFPYLYDGTVEYEENYLRTYTDSSESIVILALDGAQVVGASTGLPMDEETQEFQRPFIEHGYDPATIFYCAESILLPEYRGRGIYPRFFEGRETHARELNRFSLSAFCCVQRPEDHPLRPKDYVPLDRIWNKFGYLKHPELVTAYTWKDVSESEESPKPMVFWLKPLKHDSYPSQ